MIIVTVVFRIIDVFEGTIQTTTRVYYLILPALYAIGKTVFIEHRCRPHSF